MTDPSPVYAGPPIYAQASGHSFLHAVKAVQATKGSQGSAIHAESLTCMAPVIYGKGRGTLLDLRDRNDVPMFVVNEKGLVVSGGDPVVSAQCEVDFGFPGGGEDGTASVFVPYPAATAGMRAVCAPAPAATPDHDPEDAALERLHSYISDVQPGVGFTVTCSSLNGTWGRYLVDVVG